jgi:tRNA G18 (ribose-2'-O)-methylase SpoU
MRGYFGIGIYQPKTSENIGTLWRSAMNFGASFMFTVGARCMIRQASDTVLAFRHIPFFVYPSMDSFIQPTDCFLIGIEQCEKSISIEKFVHPERACYILGAEDHGLPEKVIEYCTGGIIQIATPMCLNVAVAGSIVMFDRNSKKQKS